MARKNEKIIPYYYSVRIKNYIRFLNCDKYIFLNDSIIAD